MTAIPTGCSSHGGGGVPHAGPRARPEAVFDYVSAPYVPYLTDRFTFSREFTAEALQRIADVRGPHAEVVRKLNLPPSFVILDRVVWGVALCSASSRRRDRGGHPRRVPARRPAGTPLGEQDAVWRALDRLSSATKWARRVATKCRGRVAGGIAWLIRTRPGRRSHRGTGASCPELFDVEESARRVGNYKWDRDEALRGPRRLGGDRPELDVKMRLGTHCYNHAWHAELWHKRLPELREMNPDRMTKPANEALERFVEALTEPEAPELTMEKLVGVYRVLIPRKVAAYTYHLNNTSQITDAPTIRSLSFILQDEHDDWRDGEMLIQSLIETPEDVERATAHQAKLESHHGGGRWDHRSGLDRVPERQGRKGERGTRRTTMRRFFPVEELARDERFNTITMRERMADPRTAMIGPPGTSRGRRPTAWRRRARTRRMRRGR